MHNYYFIFNEFLCTHYLLILQWYHFSAKLGEKLSIASGIPFNVPFPGIRLFCSLLWLWVSSSVHRVFKYRSAKRTGQPHGHPAQARACISLALPGAQSSNNTGAHSTLSFIPQPAQHWQTSHWLPPPAPEIATAWTGQRSPVCHQSTVCSQGSICPHSVQLQDPYIPCYLSELAVGEYSALTHFLSCAHSDSTAHDVFSIWGIASLLLDISHLSFCCTPQAASGGFHTAFTYWLFYLIL